MTAITLFKQHMRSQRGTILTWCITLGFLTWMMVAMYNLMAASGALQDFAEMVGVMPPYIRTLFGAGSVNTFDTYVASMEYGGVVAIAFVIFLATYVPGLVSREVDERSSEFLLGLPVSRRVLVGARWLGLVTNLSVLALFQWIVLLAAAGKEAQPGPYFLASLNTVLVNIEIGTLLFLVSIFIDEYSRAVGACAGIVTCLFFLNSMIESATGILSTLRKVLPYARVDAAAILLHGKIAVADLVIPAVISVFLLCLTVRAFETKQIAG